MGHRLFVPHMAYVPIQHYSTDNPENLKIVDKDEQIYGEMYITDWWWRTQQVFMDFGVQNATIIPVLLATDKTVLTEHARDMAQWPVYMTIGNLSHEIQRSRVRPGGMIVGLIPIHKRKSFDVKIEMYHPTMGVITKNTYNNRHLLDKILGLPFENWPDIIVLGSAVIESLLIIWADENVHPILAGMSVDYKEQVVITGIKSGMQCSIYQISPKEPKDLCQMWSKRTYKSTRAQLAL